LFLLQAMYALQIVYSRIIFINKCRLSTVNGNKFCFMRINYNFVTAVRLPDDGSRLIYNLRVQKYCAVEIKKYMNVFE